ncbi:MAG TPA: zinc metalloprotease, partial [Flavisolibacter sp.]|nr:zinc metalloprotease [Flavisolibacter sp.]
MISARHQFFFSLLLTLTFSAVAQKNNRTADAHCGTMPRLQKRLDQNPLLKTKFETERTLFSQMMTQRRLLADQAFRTQGIISIPVVFHIVMANPDLVTDAQIQSQPDTLNKGFFGANGDSVKIPDYFKPLFGKSSIQFCLAQRTPEGEPSTGIVRKTTLTSLFSVDDAVKHTSSGGDDSWNTNAYLNVWVCGLSNGILGFATFPDDGSPNEQGVVIDYRSLPGGSFTSYNAGKTLTHETGHYFNLYHIWGDDDGLCTGTDYVDDTPNQAGSTSGNFTGIKYDACTATGNGIMYQNYMDYSYDASLVMFTTQQVARMENALSVYRSSLLLSAGCQPVVRKALDAQLRAINNPSQRLCGAGFTPVITLRNNGSQTLTSAIIQTQIDNGPVTTTAWAGSLASP